MKRAIEVLIEIALVAGCAGTPTTIATPSDLGPSAERQPPRAAAAEAWNPILSSALLWVRPR